jgi:hypothetical protein
MWRHRRKLVESQAAERNRLLKVLETANIKLANVATAVFGVSGRMMLRALIEGKATPQEMAELAKGLLRKKIPELQLALKGKLEEHHRFLLALQLQRLETAEKDLAALEQRIEQQLEPYAAQLALLDTRNSCLFIDLAGIPQPRPIATTSITGSASKRWCAKSPSTPANTRSNTPNSAPPSNPGARAPSPARRQKP